RFLLKHDVDVVIGGREKEKVEKLFQWNFTFRYFDGYKPETYSAATEGITKMFLLGTEGASSVEYWKKIIDQAKSSGMEQIVFLSSLGSEFAPDRPQFLVETYLRQSGISSTILHPNFFFQNFSTDDVDDIRNGKIFWPCGNGKISFVDTR